MERIKRAIFSSKYSIHDLSRCKGEGDEHLARFNMPLELGIAMGRRYAQRRKAEKHDWLALVPEDHDYVRFVSDLAGFDLYRYDRTGETLIPKVMVWLATRPDAVRTRTPQDVVKALPRFTAEIEKLEHQWLGADPPWTDIVLAALTICRSLSNRATSAF
jgi:predicted phosphoadenosine phosphosulfate sulfurtransferase